MKKLCKENKQNFIKKEKKNVKRKKKNKFKKTKIGKFISKIFCFNYTKDRYSFSEVFVITIVSLVLGAFVCFSTITIFFNGRNYFKLSRELGKFYDAYEVLIDKYYGELNKEKLIDDAINGMVSNIDDIYTSYVSSDNASSFDEMVNGIYEGIGCTIMKQDDGLVKIVEVFSDSPSYKSGLKVGDLIKTVDHIDVTKVDVNELSSYIKYGLVSKIQIVVIRDDKELKFTVIRDQVEMPAISTKVYEKNNKKIGYMSISLFSSVSDVQFDNELKKLEKDGISSLIIDVRNNSGGYLSSVSSILSSILPKGEIIYQVEKGSDKKIVKDKTNLKREYPIAVLTNINSASASEILAASIKESYHGFVVGTKTYGKGTVQQAKELSDGSIIKYTIENWLTPKGDWIDGVGVEPTHFVELNEEYLKNPSDKTDLQLQKALELVSN